jgi:peptidoglycan/LPS O-acetylase OafA/YrhL
VTTSMKCLFVVALAAGIFEAVAAAEPGPSGLATRLVTGLFAAGFLFCAWAMWKRSSVLAASVIGVLLALEVAFTPFYERTSVSDWAVQLTFAAVALVGIVAWVDVLHSRSAHRIAAPR